MIRPLRSNICTDCPIDCNIFKYCLSVKFTADGPPPPPLTFTSTFVGSRLRLSLCNGDECRNDVEPAFFHTPPAPLSNPEAPARLRCGPERCGDTECDLCWLWLWWWWWWWCCCSFPERMSFDISCLRLAWPASSSSIFLRSSSAGGVPMLWFCDKNAIFFVFSVSVFRLWNTHLGITQYPEDSCASLFLSHFFWTRPNWENFKK